MVCTPQRIAFAHSFKWAYQDKIPLLHTAKLIGLLPICWKTYSKTETFKSANQFFLGFCTSSHVTTANICGSMILCTVNHQGLVSVDKASHQVTVKAGTTFRELIELLHQHGLAMTNLGAIPYQTVAGAISTGTVYQCKWKCFHLAIHLPQTQENTRHNHVGWDLKTRS